MTRTDLVISPSKRTRYKSAPQGEATMLGAEIDQLYRKHSRALIAHCTSLLGNANQARDAVHEAFERVIRADPTDVFETSRAVPYLYRTSTNICLDILRNRGVWRRVEPQVCARAAEAETHGPSHEGRDWARALLSRVGQRTATIGVMHFVHGMSQQEIAAELGLSRRSIFNHLKKLEQGAVELDHEGSQTPTERRLSHRNLALGSSGSV